MTTASTGLLMTASTLGLPVSLFLLKATYAEFARYARMPWVTVTAVLAAVLALFGHQFSWLGKLVFVPCLQVFVLGMSPALSAN